MVNVVQPESFAWSEASVASVCLYCGFKKSSGCDDSQAAFLLQKSHHVRAEHTGSIVLLSERGCHLYSALILVCCALSAVMFCMAIAYYSLAP